MVLSFLLQPLKAATRARQHQWAVELESRIIGLGIGEMYCIAGGWFPGCEPFYQFRNLEWVSMGWRGGRFALDHTFHFPEQPTDEEIRWRHAEIMKTVEMMRAADHEQVCSLN